MHYSECLDPQTCPGTKDLVFFIFSALMLCLSSMKGNVSNNLKLDFKADHSYLQHDPPLPISPPLDRLRQGLL